MPMRKLVAQFAEVAREEPRLRTGRGKSLWELVSCESKGIRDRGDKGKGGR